MQLQVARPAEILVRSSACPATSAQPRFPLGGDGAASSRSTAQGVFALSVVPWLLMLISRPGGRHKILGSGQGPGIPDIERP